MCDWKYEREIKINLNLICDIEKHSSVSTSNKIVHSHFIYSIYHKTQKTSGCLPKIPVSVVFRNTGWNSNYILYLHFVFSQAVSSAPV